ncbi:HigA family addiction module antitoxin [Desulfobacterales bacterium HSG17]|nr:HigA family addiction module antitoxin [Desulfobacterales bacterium HSG17]
MKRDFNPTHPGEILLEEFLNPMGIKLNQLAGDISVSPRQIYEIINFKKGINADMALRLARYFRMSVDFWTGIQIHYETEMAKMALGDRLDKEVKVYAPAA